MNRNNKILFIVLMFIPMLGFSQSSKPSTFSNPVLSTGPDPWVFQYRDTYYYMNTVSGQLKVWRTKDITNLREAESMIVWHPSDKNQQAIWAPEIHRFNEKWYIYFSMVDKGSQLSGHQMYVLENDSEDPFKGEFKMKGHIATDKECHNAIDGSVFEHLGKLYMIWSGHEREYIDKVIQCIYLAQMKNPWKIGSERIILSKPEHDWEMHNAGPDGSCKGRSIFVNEGPEALKSPDGQYVHIVYSASGCWTPYYQLGLITAKADADLLDSASWKKSDEPVFQQNADAGVYGTGHNGFFKSPDGTEDYIIYHARDVKFAPPHSPLDLRSPRIQKFEWKDGYPVFGTPVPVWIRLSKPAGTAR